MVSKLLQMGANSSQFGIGASGKLRRDGGLDFFPVQPLDYASAHISNTRKAKRISGLLIDAGADVNGFGRSYRAPIANAVIHHEGKKTKEMIDFFLAKGADIHAPLNHYGGSRLLNMLAIGGWEWVDYYLAKGADPSLLDFTGWNFMWDIEKALQRMADEDKPDMQRLHRRMIDEYGLSSPAERQEEEGKALRIACLKEKGWVPDGKQWGHPDEIPFLEEAKRLQREQNPSKKPK